MSRSWRYVVLQILASLFMAFVIWLIARQSDMETSWVLAKVELRDVPPNMVIDATPREVQLNVQYPREVSNRIVGRSFTVPLKIETLFPSNPADWPAPSQPKSVDYPLSRNRLDHVLQTQMAQVVGIDPPQITLTGRLLSRLVPIEVRTTQSLTGNLSLAAQLKPDPPQVAITGPRELLDKTSSLLTSPINLAEIKNSTRAFPNLLLPPGVMLLDPAGFELTVDVAISERSVRQTIANVPVNYLPFSGLAATSTPPAADVVIEGPSSAIESISAEDISFVFARDLPEVSERKYEVGIEARLKASVPPEVAGQVTIIECRPPRITVEFTAAAPQNTVPAAP